MGSRPRFPGIPVTANGNQLISTYTEARLTEGGVFYPITPSTEAGELYQQAYAEGRLNVFGRPLLAIEAEGEHAAQGGAIALSVTGKRVVNFTSGQGLVYGLEQYFHAPGKLSTMVVEVVARALTRHALNVHCGHDDVYTALGTGWIVLFAKDAQQAADQALILRRTVELALTPGLNCQDGFLTSHLERTFRYAEAELIREYLGSPDDQIDSPTEAQQRLFGPRRRRVPSMIDLAHPVLLGPVQNQEHYMQGVVARRDAFIDPILGFLQDSYRRFSDLTGRHYGMISAHRADDARTVFLSLGSAAENVEAAVDYLREGRGCRVGSLHLNVLRPFPERELLSALAGKETVIVLERTDEPMAVENPLAREVRAALQRAADRGQTGPAVRVVPATYGLGSRDFRPEHILGAYEYATGRRPRQDGRSVSSGTESIVLGVEHDHAVISDERPSLLPRDAIAVRFHSIGGWGAITTGKNLGAILGAFGDYLSKRSEGPEGPCGASERIHVSANPKYGSEKKGAPTSYFLVAAPERIRVNCELRHVDVVLCCDPKAFTHTNPLEGMAQDGAFVWESAEPPETAWERIPRRLRQEILDKRIRLYTLPGFEIARSATDRPDLQLRMQGNAFLGAFFRVSPFLERNGISAGQFRDVVREQYRKKFGRFGDNVVASNMEVMEGGFERVRRVPPGSLDAPDRSGLRGAPLLPMGGPACVGESAGCGQPPRPPFARTEVFESEFRSGRGYDQAATPLMAVGVSAAATGAKASKYVARREAPVFLPENCTQCMECIAVCPDTALPCTAQDVGTVLQGAIGRYVTNPGDRGVLMGASGQIETCLRDGMKQAIREKAAPRLGALARPTLDRVEGASPRGREELISVLDRLPFAYARTNAIFSTPERKQAGSGGLFGLFLGDLCKGCGACVVACGDRRALRMEPETEALHAEMQTARAFLDLLPDTASRYLGLFDPENPRESKAAALRNHLLVRRNYEAFVGGDGACAGCGEKGVLRAIASLTEAYMRPLYRAKAKRLQSKADRLDREGEERLRQRDRQDPQGAARFRRAVEEILLGSGGESEADARARRAVLGSRSDTELLAALAAILRQDAFNHGRLQTVDGRWGHGLSVMAMGAHTGCNTVFSSTPPNNPHSYPWMNSLFQDGITVAWLFGESFILDHARRSVIPERLTDILLDRTNGGVAEGELFELFHFSDALMTDLEISELPKAWAVGGDGGMGDIGFQNVSKVVLQNRPNVKAVMLDTQVYSNTGGQNSDSSPPPGGADMNQVGAATQGKLTEMKGVAEALTTGHGSPFVARVSMANAARFYKVVLDALEYRGTAFLQCFATCPPEHGTGDDVSVVQARRVRDSRGLPDFVFDPRRGETSSEALSLEGNPDLGDDWAKGDDGSTRYTVAHWAVTEARFRHHFKKITEQESSAGVPLENLLLAITQDDVVHRRYLDPAHRAFVPDFRVFIRAERRAGSSEFFALSRQMVLFCVERRKAWRLLQSRAGLVSSDYRAQKDLLAGLEAGRWSRELLWARGLELLQPGSPLAQGKAPSVPAS